LNRESALITKLIKTKEINKAFTAKVSNSIQLYGDVWKWIEDYYVRYKGVPTLEVIVEKFPDFVPTDTEESLDFLIDEVNGEFLKKKLGELMEKALISIDDDPRETLSYIFSKASALGHQTDIVKDVNVVEDYWMRLKSLRERAEMGSDMLGIPSGISPLDVLFGGWQSGDFIALMGWTASGKTWLSTMLAVNAWRMGKVPLYFSLEMDDKQFGYRVDTLMAAGAFSNTSLINGKNISADAYEDWMRQEYREKHPFYLVTNEGLDEINQYTVQMKIEQYKPDIVFLDYHGLFDDAKKGRSDTEKHRNLSKDFKRMAVRYGVPIVDIVAVTMSEGHELRGPELNEVAWSKQIAYDADLVLSVFKQGQLMTVEAKKSRRSELFAFKLLWDLDVGKWSLHDF
jgi:hypothetical protein